MLSSGIEGAKSRGFLYPLYNTLEIFLSPGTRQSVETKVSLADVWPSDQLFWSIVSRILADITVALTADPADQLFSSTESRFVSDVFPHSLLVEEFETERKASVYSWKHDISKLSLEKRTNFLCNHYHEQQHFFRL